MFLVLKPSQSTLFSGKIYLSKPYGRHLNFTKESFVLFKTIVLELVKNKNYRYLIYVCKSTGTYIKNTIMTIMYTHISFSHPRSPFSKVQ